MTEQEKIQAMLKTALPPSNTELPRDLWPSMLRRMDERSAAVPWYDWVLALAGVALLAFLPKLLPVLLYNL